MAPIVIRQNESLFSVTYDPQITTPSNTRSYESCRDQIKKAYEHRIIDEEAKENLIGKLNHERGMYESRHSS